MWIHILLTVTFSIITIAILHHLIQYMKDTYTVKKTKNITDFHSQKYKSILETVQDINEKEKQILEEKLRETQIVKEYQLSKDDLQEMNADLDRFVQDQMMSL